MHVRPAVRDDIPALVTIAASALPSNPQWQYLYPDLEVGSQEHLDTLEQEFLRDFEGIDKGERMIMVAEIIESSNGGNKKAKPVSLSAWVWHDKIALNQAQERAKRQTVATAITTTTTAATDLSRDARQRACQSSITAVMTTWLTGNSASNRMHLRMIATQPGHQSRGAASELVRWGKKQSVTRGLPLTLFSDGSTKQFYKNLEFVEMGIMTVQVEGEEVGTELVGLVYNSTL